MPGVSLMPTLQQCDSASSSWGHDAPHWLTEKIKRGGNVSILVLGASGSCGRWSRIGQFHSSHRQKPPAYPDATVLLPDGAGDCGDRAECNPLHSKSAAVFPTWNAWPTHLEKLLRSCWENERVHVRNQWCREQPASGTAMLVGVAAAKPETFDADVVLLETANNDLPADTPAFREQALATNEILATQLRELPLARLPFVMFLETSWRYAARGQHVSGEEWQLQALRRHQLAHTSLTPITAALHESHKATAPKGGWLPNVYFQDLTHPSRFGQKLIAGVVARRLTSQLVARLAAPSTESTDGAKLLHDGPSERQFLTEQASAFFSVANAARSLLDFTDPSAHRSFVVHKSGFARQEDVAGKPGFIAKAIGAELVVRLPPSSVAALIGPLCTYENAGALELALVTVPAATSSSSCPDYARAAKAGSRVVLSTVDTLWAAKASLHWWLPTGLSAAHAAPCMWLAMRVVNAEPPRQEHKVKLLALLVSHSSD